MFFIPVLSHLDIVHPLTNPDHILYVDDEEALLEIGRAFLERAGSIIVDTTSNPLEACETIMAGRYDAVVSDYMMPGMDGIALLKHVREAGSRVPFIIFTGRGREEVAIEALNSGADFYLQKGGDPRAQFADLANAVRQLAGKQRAEAALRRSEDMLHRAESIFRAAPTGIGMAVDGVVTEVNERLCDLLGYTRDELVGQSMRLLYPGDAEYESALQQMDVQIRKAGTCTLETRCMRKDGATLDVQFSSTPLDPEDPSRGVTFTTLDISEHTALEREIAYHAEELVRQTNGLAVANRKLNLMSSITRHDILNQLTILLGNLWMVEEAEPGEDISEHLARVKGSADRIHRQIEFTRDYTDLGVRSPEWQRVSDALGTEGLHGLPVENEAGDLAVYADPMLATVFSNLMDNTIRHGESVTRVCVRYHPGESGDLTLIWEDDGAGVPAGEKERIFHRGVGKNTGLGLFLIREILGITGIRITETGEPGNGARFEMLVPRGMYRV
ncbi:multi-sensor signal transduction histidine kinase [Methanoculleus marisnigri JR1]|uniref:Multi-sensor signal transduction histidine kinase n=1 Tax=Methanoculleus marisnigri (strain ATCC 35101 / DSM 1498 / JR1) TaxID=368407 RepID=A3CTV5_METMJ|nr:multi-sensor signal transduction histidine kinase [Methanoculleus marisnigri JR1]